MIRIRRSVLRALLAALLMAACLPASAVADWFEKWKAAATPQQLYTFLYALPKGGDLHNHLGGAGRAEWWWEAALAQESRGYLYYTKVRIQNCRDYGTDEHGSAPYLLLFRNIPAGAYEKLDACEKSEYKRLQDLTPREQEAWLASLRLTTPHDGREEFFEAEWRRIDALQRNPYIMTAILLDNMEAFGREGLAYLETQSSLDGLTKPDGSPYTQDEAAGFYRALLAGREAKATGVEVRFQTGLTRFAPDAEERLRARYAMVDRYRDLYVGVNLVGREDNGKGYPLRFLPVLRELRRHYADIHLSIHAGETEEPNSHVRDSLLLGAERIGHGVNLITDPETMLLMRHGPYLVEINLISNLLLQYVPNFQAHPFPEYLRTGIPVALSTDDRGMWDSNLTDEYFVAVREFNLSWEELVQLGRSSLAHSFVDEPTKQRLLSDYERRMAAFEQAFRAHGLAALKDVKPVSYTFTCRHYQLCLMPPAQGR